MKCCVFFGTPMYYGQNIKNPHCFMIAVEWNACVAELVVCQNGLKLGSNRYIS